MRDTKKSLAWLLSFLTGVFWALTVVGFINGLTSNLESGYIYAITVALLFSTPGILGIVFIEFLINSLEQTELLKEQNNLLKQLLNQDK